MTVHYSNNQDAASRGNDTQDLAASVAPAVQGLFSADVVPDWFSEAMRMAFSEKEHHVFLWDTCGAAAAAIDIFVSTQFWAGTTGWSVKYRADDTSEIVLVVEPVAANADFIAAVVEFCAKTNLTFVIGGVSWSQLSTTFRIEIFPKGIF